ncbi:hypothetical protein NXS19_006682 [Fusarium pseudograminearum]|nr:hypothetical protein NXS19_006682 [Fusarium pseudograminearum]
MPQATVLDVGRRLDKTPEDPVNGPLHVKKVTNKDDDYEVIAHPKDCVLAIDDDDDDCESPLVVADTTSPTVGDKSAAVASPAAIGAQQKHPLIKRATNKNARLQMVSALQFLQPEMKSKNCLATPTEDFHANQVTRNGLTFDTVGESTWKNTT